MSVPHWLSVPCIAVTVVMGYNLWEASWVFQQSFRNIILRKVCLVCQRAHVTSYVVSQGMFSGSCVQTGFCSIDQPLWMGKWQQAFEWLMPFSSWEGKLGKAGTMLLVLLNCGMLVLDPVILLCTLSASFYLLRLPLCQNCCYCQGKKTLCFSTVSPFHNL